MQLAFDIAWIAFDEFFFSENIFAAVLRLCFSVFHMGLKNISSGFLNES